MVLKDLPGNTITSTTFTDSLHLQSVSAGAQTPNPVVAGNAATYTVTTSYNGSGSCTATFSTIAGGGTGLPAGATPTFTPSSISSPTTASSLSISTLASVPAGTYTFEIQAAGSGGCTETQTTALLNFVVSNTDSTPPTVGVSGAPGSWTNVNQTAGVTCNDGAGSGCNAATNAILVSGSNPGSCSTTYSNYTVASSQTISSHQWVCTAEKDNAGNTGFSSPVEFQVDETNPTGSLTSPADNSFVAVNNPTISGTSSDAASGVQKVETNIDGGGFVTATGTTSWSKTTSGLSQSSHSLVFRVTDNAGNVFTSSTTHFTIDTTNPTSTISSPSDNSFSNSTTVALSGTSSDTNLQKTEISVDGGAFQATSGTAASWTFSATGLSQGSHTFQSKATDLAGNTGLSSIVHVTVDTIPPTVTAVDSDGQTYNAATVSPHTIKATFSENISNTPTISVSGSGQIVNDCSDGNAATFCFAYTIPAGVDSTTKTITISGAQDAATNTMTTNSSHTFIVDTKAPTLSPVHIQSNNANTNFAKVGDTVTVSFTASESITGTTVTIAGHAASLSGSGTGPYSATYTMVSGDTEGIIPFSISGFKDAANNTGTSVSSTTDASSVTFDKTNPTGSWTTPNNGDTISGTGTLTVNAADTGGSGVASVKFQYQRNNGIDSFHNIATVTSGPYTSPWDSSSLTLDTYNLRAIITDNAGNVTNVDEQVDVAAVITSELNQTTSFTSFNVSWTTDRPTSGQVVWDTTSHPTLGAAPTYGYSQATSTVDVSPHTTSHSINISGLNPGTTYYFRIVSAGSPTVVSGELSVTTYTIPGAGPGGSTGVVATTGTIGGVLGTQFTGTGIGGGQVLGANFLENFGVGQGEQVKGASVSAAEATPSATPTETPGETAGVGAGGFNLFSLKNWWWLIIIIILGTIYIVFFRRRKDEN